MKKHGCLFAIGSKKSNKSWKTEKCQKEINKEDEQRVICSFLSNLSPIKQEEVVFFAVHNVVHLYAAFGQARHCGELDEQGGSHFRQSRKTQYQFGHQWRGTKK